MQLELLQTVELLQSADSIAPESIMRKLGVSERTVRNYVARINRELDGIAHISKRRGAGYALEVFDPAVLADRLSNARRREVSMPQSISQRAYYLANDLLSRNDWVTIETLARELYVSRFTVSESLKDVEDLLGRYDLVLERRGRLGLRVGGEEINRRMCQANLIIEQVAGDITAINEDVDKILRRITDHVDEAIGLYHLKLSAIARQNLLIHLAIAVMRLRAGHSIPIDARLDAELQRHPLVAVAQHIADAIGREFSIDLPHEEVEYIALHLMGKQILDTVVARGTAQTDEAPAPLSEDIWDDAKRMVQRVWEVFDFDFREDFELHFNLARHILPLTVRLQTGMKMQNPLLVDIKKRYSLAFAMAQEASTVLSQAHGELSEDETGYIALTFELALERQREHEMRRLNILLVCATGAGTARLLEHRFREEFGDHLETITACDVQSVGSIDLSRTDCAFTTVPLTQPLPIPVFKVGAFLDENEMPYIRAALTKKEPAATLARFFDPALFFAHKTFATKADVIAFLCKRLNAARNADDDMERLVWQREKIAVTSFGNQVAMPHPADPVVENTVIEVCLLDEPVNWGPGKDVRAIFMVCIGRTRDPDLQPLYRSLARIMGSEDAIDTLISQQDFTVLLELLDHR